MKKVYVSYYTSSEAIATEILAKHQGLVGKLVSIPRELSSGCGMAFETTLENKVKIQSLLDQSNIEYEQIHELER